MKSKLKKHSSIYYSVTFQIKILFLDSYTSFPTQINLLLLRMKKQNKIKNNVTEASCCYENNTNEGVEKLRMSPEGHEHLGMMLVFTMVHCCDCGHGSLDVFVHQDLITLYTLSMCSSLRVTYTSVKAI